MYFAFSCAAATTHVASGIFVPMLVIGSCVGRVAGLAVVDVFEAFNVFATAHAVVVDVEAAGNFKWEWIDPGIFALIGCGAFMGGVTRLTVSIAVITMEITNEVRFLLPIMAAIMAAKYVADRLMPTPLYHALIELGGVPFLHMRPDVGKLLDLYDTRELLGGGHHHHHHHHGADDGAEGDDEDDGPEGPPGAPDTLHGPRRARAADADGGLSACRFSGVVCVRELESVGNIRRVLARTSHSSFPVVKPATASHLLLPNEDEEARARGMSTADSHVYAGVISRDHLRRVLDHEAGAAPGAGALSYVDLVRGDPGDDAPGGGRRAAADAGKAGRAGGRAGGGGDADGIAMMAFRREIGRGVRAGDPGADADALRVDLRDYVDHAAMSVYDRTPVRRCYDIFVVMGLRSLVVVNENNAVVGIITRKDLLPERVEAVLELDANGYDDLEL